MGGIDGYTKFLSHFNGNNGAKEIVDSGAIGHVVTQVGTATLSSAQAKFGLCSLLLDGDSDSVSMPDSDAFDVFASASESWTIDFWIRPTDVTSGQRIICQWEDHNNLWFLTLHDNVIAMMACTGGGATYLITLTTDANSIPTPNQWYHIAGVKKLNEYGIYVNGVQKAYVQDNDTAVIAGALYIGVEGGYASPSYYSGYIDEVRIIKSNIFSASPNVGKTDTITVPTSAHISDADTKLLLHFESHDVSSNTTPKIPTFVGTAQINTAQKKFGTGALLLDGNSDYVTVPDSTDWDIWNDDATIDFWVYFNSLAGHQTFVGQRDDLNNHWQIWFNSGGSDTKIGLSCVSGGVTKAYYLTTSDTGMVISTWYHLAFVRSGSSCLIFLDGTLLGVTESAAFDTFADISAVLSVGYTATWAYFNGCIDELRISKGIARWTSNFTPPTVPFSRVPRRSKAGIIF